jgi:5-methylthioadenosine/S-adenosylhomocysteine deaminase
LNQVDVDVSIMNCTIVAMDKKQPIIEKGLITIKNGQITYVGRKSKSSLSIKAEKAIDGEGKVALPGLVNCHTHVAMTLFRGVAEDKPLDEWLRNTVWALEAKLKTSDIHDGALLGCLEMIKSGTTCFADMYFHEEIVAKVVEKAGLRAVLAPGIIEAEDAGRGERMLKDAVNVARKYHDYAGGRVKVQLGPHALYSCSPNLLRRVREAALSLGVGVHVHLAESPDTARVLKSKFGFGEVELLEHIGFLKDLHVLAAHCVCLGDDEMRLLAQRGVNVAYNPVANMKLGMGAPKVNDMLKLGVTVGIGTDGPASNNTLDMFESMKMASLLQKVFYRDPTVLPAKSVLRMATLDGARALGLEKFVGSLEVGKRADLILVDFDKPHLTPLHDLYANLVYSAHGSDVDTVIVDGKVLMEKRKVNMLDEAEVMKKAQRTAMNLVTKKA